MDEVDVFTQTVRLQGRITIPETVRTLKNIKPQDILYVAVASKPFKATLFE